jgi:hypothetical protein
MDTTSKRPTTTTNTTTTTTPHPRKKKLSSSSHWSQHYERMYKNVTYTLIQPPSNIPPGTPHRYFHSSFRVDHYGSDEPQTTTTTTVNINNNDDNNNNNSNNNNSDSDATFGTDRRIPDKPRQVHYSHVIHQHVNGLLIVTAATPPPPPPPPFPLTSISAASIVMSHKNNSYVAVQWVLPSISVTTSINGTNPSHVTDHNTNDDSQQRAIATSTKDSHTAIERQSKLTLPLKNSPNQDNFQASISTPSRPPPSDDTLTHPFPVLQRIVVLPDSVLAIGMYVTDDTMDTQQHQQQEQKQQKHQQPFLCGVWGTLIDWNQNLSPLLINDDALMDGFLAIVQPIGPFPPTKFTGSKYASVCQPDF